MALAYIDDAVDRPTDGAELAIQQLRKKRRRQRFTARRELNVAEHALRWHAAAHGARRYVIDLDVGIEIKRLKIDDFVDDDGSLNDGTVVVDVFIARIFDPGGGEMWHRFGLADVADLENSFDDARMKLVRIGPVNHLPRAVRILDWIV